MALNDRSPGLREARRVLIRSLLGTLLVFYSVAAVIMLIAGFAFSEPEALVLSSMNIATCGGALLLRRHDRLQLSGMLVCTGLLATAIWLVWSSVAGLEDATVILYPVVAAFSALLLTRRALQILFPLMLLSVVIVGFRDRLGLGYTDESVPPPPVDVVLVLIAITLVVFSLRKLSNSLWETLNRAVHHEERLLESNTALQDQTLLARKTEQRWRSLVDAAPDWILQLDQTGRILLCNRDGLLPDDRPISHLQEMVAAADRPRVEAALERTLKLGRTAEAEAEILGDETVRTVSFHLGTLREGDRITGAIVLAADVSEHHNLREQLLKTQKLDSLGRLAGGIAHDFNNLLTIICGHADLARYKTEAGEDIGEEIRMIAEAGERAADLTQQILAFGRRQTLRPHPMHLPDALESMDRMLSRLIGSDIQLDVDTAAALPVVMADKAQLEQVITNLVINARDAIHAKENSDERRIRITARSLQVDNQMLDQLLGLEPGLHVELSVTDTGTGMSREVQQRLFEPFFTTKPPGKGTGLGLATVYGIIHQSGGAVSVYSELGRGTSFKIYLPTVEQVQTPQASDRDNEVTGNVRGSEHVLLVEDDRGVRGLARAALESMGYQVTEAGDGEQALDLIASDLDFDIVVTDVVMPGISGFELSRRLPAHLPVLLTSGYAEEAWAAGGGLGERDSFLQKPYGPAELAGRIRELLDR